MTFILLNWHLKLKIFSTSVRRNAKHSPNFTSVVPEGLWSVVIFSVSFPSTLMISQCVFVVKTRMRWINPDIMVTVSSSFDIIWASQSLACPFTARKMQDMLIWILKMLRMLHFYACPHVTSRVCASPDCISIDIIQPCCLFHLQEILIRLRWDSFCVLSLSLPLPLTHPPSPFPVSPYQRGSRHLQTCSLNCFKIYSSQQICNSWRAGECM